MDKPLDWSKLPANLSYLAAPAEKYGGIQGEDEMFEFLRGMSQAEKADLTAVLDRVKEDGDDIDLWIDDHPITEHREAALVHFLKHMLSLGAEAGFFPVKPAEGWNTVENHIQTLGKFGSFRLASKRAIAARFLAKWGPEARPAIPALRKALADKDLRVCVWAHYALAVIEGNRAEHEAAVRKIYAQHDKKDSLGCHLENVGEEASEVLEKFKELPST